MPRSVPSVLLAALVILAAGCGPGDAPETAPSEATPGVAHLQACLNDAPTDPCPANPEADGAYWTAQQEAQSGAYLDAAELCLRAAIDGHKAAREGACVDVYQAYVAEGVRSDLGGRLDETEARRGYAKARIALQRQRSQTFIDGMRATPGPDVPQTID